MNVFSNLVSDQRQKLLYCRFRRGWLVKKAITELNSRLRVSKIYFTEKGEQAKVIESKAQPQAGEAFVRTDMVREEASPYMEMKASSSVRYDRWAKS